MILQNTLYRIVGEKRERSSGVVAYMVKLCDDNIIYKAHFPGKPVTPGVCVVQMVVELMEKFCGRKLVLCQIKNAKFLRMLSPGGADNIECRFLKIEMKGDSVSLECQVGGSNTVFAKLSLICRATE